VSLSSSCIDLEMSIQPGNNVQIEDETALCADVAISDKISVVNDYVCERAQHVYRFSN
jgi:hypothetical protein